MPSAFTRDARALVAQVNPGLLSLPLNVGGKIYTVKAPTAEAWLTLQAQATMTKVAALTDAGMLEEAQTPPLDLGEIDTVPSAETAAEAGELFDRGTFHRRILGDVLQEMVDDAVEFPLIDLCAQTAWLFFFFSPEDAETFWVGGGSLGKAPAGEPTTETPTH